mgnify:CR=1 FL=1
MAIIDNNTNEGTDTDVKKDKANNKPIKEKKKEIQKINQETAREWNGSIKE